MSTETDLRDWRFGQINAERLCAGILSVEGYADIQPQAPLGGADGAKDILASRDGKLWVAAVYFPTTPKTFAEVRAKFVDDLRGIERNQAHGFVFLVNQHLTLGNRAELEGRSSAPVELYHVERLRNVLDSPVGYGLRLEYLGRGMTVEEQTAFVRVTQTNITEVLRDQHQATQAKLDLLLHRTIPAPGAIPVEPSSILGAESILDQLDHPTSHLDAATLSLLHRTITQGGSAEANGGQLRSMQVWIGTVEQPVFVPPSPDEVPQRLADLLAWWRSSYSALSASDDRETVVRALARLHHDFVSIHPFEDANGRMSRLLLDNAARELLGERLGPRLTRDLARYFESLHAADGDDLGPLTELVAEALISDPDQPDSNG